MFSFFHLFFLLQVNDDERMFKKKQNKRSDARKWYFEEKGGRKESFLSENRNPKGHKVSYQLLNNPNNLHYLVEVSSNPLLH